MNKLLNKLPTIEIMLKKYIAKFIKHKWVLEALCFTYSKYNLKDFIK